MSGYAWVRVGAVLGFLAVVVGSFGAHGVKERLDALGTAATFQTGVEYHFYHALGLLAVGLLAVTRGRSASTDVAGWSFLVGVLIFSGSLYALGLSGIRILGAITPIGGVAFLVGWVAFALAAGTPAETPEPAPTTAQRAAAPAVDYDPMAHEATLIDMPTAGEMEREMLRKS